MAKLLRWIGLAGFLLLLAASLLPWTYYADLDKYFNGFYSEKNIYGRPGIFLLIVGGMSALFSALPLAWLKRFGLFLGAINIAYAFVIYIRFSSCYQGYCPEIHLGLPLMLFSVFLILISTLFPSGRIKVKPEVESSTLEKLPEGNGK